MPTHAPENSKPDDPKSQVVRIVESFTGGYARPVAGVHLSLEVRGKRFGWFMENHHGDNRISINCKANPGMVQSFVQSNPEIFHIPRYCRYKGCLGIWLDVPNLDWDEIEAALLHSCQLTAAKTPN